MYRESATFSGFISETGIICEDTPACGNQGEYSSSWNSASSRSDLPVVGGVGKGNGIGKGNGRLRRGIFPPGLGVTVPEGGEVGV